MITLNHTRSAVLPLRTRRLALFSRLLGALSLRRQRDRLADLDPHMLEDIGITRAQALTEAARPMWDAPQHWTC